MVRLESPANGSTDFTAAPDSSVVYDSSVEEHEVWRARGIVFSSAQHTRWLFAEVCLRYRLDSRCSSVGRMPLSRRLMAEILGTFWLVFGGCGSAVLAAGFPKVGIGLLGVSLAFGLTVLTMAYAIGHVSGCHLNPAVSVGLMVGKRFPAREVPAYVAAQVVGGAAGAAVLYSIASGAEGFTTASGFAANGFAAHSPGGYSMFAALIAEIVLTLFFLLVILGATDSRAPAGFAPIPIGLALTLIHLIGIPVTNLSVNPARSTGPALFVGGWALEQLWLFWLAPIVGAALAGLIYPALFGSGHPPAVRGVKEAETGTVARGA
jgi:aquaporin Z